MSEPDDNRPEKLSVARGGKRKRVGKKLTGAADSRGGRGKLDDDEKVRIALDRFSPLLEGKRLTPIGVLKKKYGRDSATIVRSISDAFKRKLVRLHRARPATWERREDIETQLRSSLPQIWNRIVIEAIAPATQDGLKRRNDSLHEMAGEALASVVALTRTVKPGARIGVGPGRGVFCVAWALKGEEDKPQLEDIELISLSGMLHASRHDPDRTMVVDADINCNILAMAYECRGIQLRFVSRPILDLDSVSEGNLKNVPRDPQTGNLSRVNELLHEAVAKNRDDFSWPKPALNSNPKNRDDYTSGPRLTHALVGVGTLSEGHRLWVRPLPDFLDCVGWEIERLCRISIELNKRFEGCGDAPYFPIGDINNHLFLIDPPDPSDRVFQARSDELKTIIGMLNRAFLTVGRGIERAEEIWVVACTVEKARALHQVLTARTAGADGGRDEEWSHPEIAPRVRFLATDVACAQALLTLKAR